MPSSIATVLIALGALLAAAGEGAAGVVAGGGAVIFEVALFVLAGLGGVPDSITEQ